MKKVGEIFDLEGNVSKIIFKNELENIIIIQMVDSTGEFINKIALDASEIEKLHQSMRKIEKY